MLGIHTALVTATKIPELEIDRTEAAMLAKATADIAKHYPVVASVLDGKIMDHIAFFGAISAVYGTRLVAIQARRDREKRAAQTPNVRSLHG